MGRPVRPGGTGYNVRAGSPLGKLARLNGLTFDALAVYDAPANEDQEVAQDLVAAASEVTPTAIGYSVRVLGPGDFERVQREHDEAAAFKRRCGGG